MEYPLDYFPEESYFRILHPNLHNVNSELDQITRSIFQLHLNMHWRTEEILGLKEDLDDLLSRNVIIFSTFLHDGFSFVFHNILPVFDKIKPYSKKITKKFKIGSLLFKIINSMLSAFTTNLERYLIIN